MDKAPIMDIDHDETNDQNRLTDVNVSGWCMLLGGAEYGDAQARATHTPIGLYAMAVIGFIWTSRVTWAEGHGQATNGHLAEKITQR